MTDLLKALIKDNIEERYKILVKMESTRVYHIVRKFAEIRVDNDYKLTLGFNNNISQLDELSIIARTTSVRNDINKYNEDCSILNEFLNGLQGQERLEALEYYARECETAYKNFKRAYINMLKGQGKLPSDFKSDYELPMHDLEACGATYTEAAMVTKQCMKIALKHLQKALNDEQEEILKA